MVASIQDTTTFPRHFRDSVNLWNVSQTKSQFREKPLISAHLSVSTISEHRIL